MVDNKNMELNDEMMAKASGGSEEPTSENKFNIGDHVHWQDHENLGEGEVTDLHWNGHAWWYTVFFASCGADPDLPEHALY